MSSSHPARLFPLVPKRALAVFAHPDDADVSCGGTLGAWAAQGCAVHLIVVTKGEKGTSDRSADTEELAQRRTQEMFAAARSLNLASVECLEIPDGEAPEALWLLGALVKRIRKHAPEVCLGHDPTSVLFGSVYASHRDHRAAGWALLDAVAPASAMPHYFPEAGAPWAVEHLLMAGTLSPDAFVDITGSLDAKIEAVQAHRSQLGEETGWVADSVRQRAEDDGAVVGVQYAEGFRHLILNG